MPTFSTGEIVNVTIKGARIAGDDGRIVKVTYGNGRYLIPLADDTTEVTIERIAPPEWPVRPGDLWRDSRNVLWFARDTADYGNESAERIVMDSPGVHEHGEGYRPEVVNDRYGPMTLVHRESPAVAL